MGNRGGDLDPAILTYLQRTAGMSVDDVDDLLQHRSGLLGLCGADDMRTVLSRRADGGDGVRGEDARCGRRIGRGRTRSTRTSRPAASGCRRPAVRCSRCRDPDAALAFEVYCHRIRKYIGAYHAVLGRIDAIVFTAGVGEHAAEVRAASLAGLDMWGITIDPDRNAATDGARVISPDTAAVAVCVVPTDEELAIARHTAELIERLNPTRPR